MTKIKKDIVVEAPVEVVYDLWRNFENFPRFMEHIKDVRVTSDKMSHWKAEGPLGLNAEWDAEITLDEPQRAIGWRTVEGASSVITAGRVNFQPEQEGRTHLDVTIEYAPPGGPVGDLVAKVFSNPERHVEEDLDRFRQVIEGVAGDPLTSVPADDIGAVTENDLEQADRVAANGNVPPAGAPAVGPPDSLR